MVTSVAQSLNVRAARRNLDSAAQRHRCFSASARDDSPNCPPSRIPPPSSCYAKADGPCLVLNIRPWFPPCPYFDSAWVTTDLLRPDLTVPFRISGFDCTTQPSHIKGCASGFRHFHTYIFLLHPSDLFPSFQVHHQIYVPTYFRSRRRLSFTTLIMGKSSRSH